MNEPIVSKYLQYLPAIYRENPDEAGPTVLECLLQSCELLLSGEPQQEGSFGIEMLLDRFADYFDFYRTPEDLLPWLAGWVGIDWPEGPEPSSSRIGQLVPFGKPQVIERSLLVKLAGLSRKRGTVAGLAELLQLYLGDTAQIIITDHFQPFQVGVTSRLGTGDSVLGHGRPGYFEAKITLPSAPDGLLLQKKRLVLDLIDQEKPAYLYYTLFMSKGGPIHGK